MIDYTHAVQLVDTYSDRRSCVLACSPGDVYGQISQ